MLWVDVEEESGAWAAIAGVLGLVIGVVVWWYRVLLSGVFALLVIWLVAILVNLIWFQILLPRDARRAAKNVRSWFRAQFPEERVESVAVRAVDPERYVIVIRHGFGFPTPRSYFAIARPELEAIAELPASEWWPRGLK
jgi:hypothetical protein